LIYRGVSEETPKDLTVLTVFKLDLSCTTRMKTGIHISLILNRFLIQKIRENIDKLKLIKLSKKETKKCTYKLELF